MSNPAIFNDSVVTFNSSTNQFRGWSVPAAPVLSLVPNGNNSVNLSWTVPSGTVVGYFVYIGTASGVYTNTINVGNATSYSVQGLATFGIYYFVVTASGTNGQSTYSNQLSYAVTVPVVSTYVDFSQVMPSIFLRSPLLTDYMAAISTLLGNVQEEIQGLYYLVNPYTVPTQYLQDLANLLGLQLRSSSYLPSTSQRQQLISAVDWYKIKGTYASISYIGTLLSLNIAIRDLWCSSSTNYNNGVFVPENWFVDATGSSYPSDLTSSYFDTPHFGMFIELNQVYGTFPSQYLWNDTAFSDLQYFTEQTRPVQTVPHYYIELDCQANEVGGITENPGNIYSSVNNWSFSTVYYDQVFTTTLTANKYSGYDWGATAAGDIISGTLKLYNNGGLLIATDNGSGGWTSVASGYSFSGPINYSTGVVKVTIAPIQASAPYLTYQQNLYDNSLLYDESYLTFIQSIQNWKLGTGDVNATNPPTGGVATPVLSGSGVTLKQFPTYNQFIFTVPLSTVQAGITELGLYTTGGSLVFVSYFPSILKTNSESLYVVVTINKT